MKIVYCVTQKQTLQKRRDNTKNNRGKNEVTTKKSV